MSGGKYPITEPAAAATSIFPATKPKTGTVTFMCQGNGDVTFDAPVFSFYPGVSGIAFNGGCFRFHIPTFGYGGYPKRTHDISLTGVHMDSFEILGAANITIRNSEVGPFVSCYGADEPVPEFAKCDPNSPDPTERFYAQQPNGATGLQQEPFIHNGAAGLATNVVLDGVRIHHITSKRSGTHTGGLIVWDTDGLTIKNSKFHHNAIYDIMFNVGSSDSNVTIENNVFGFPVYSKDPAEPDPGGELPVSYRELGIGTGPGTTNRNWLIRYNRFVHGFTTDGRPGTKYLNVRLIGNVLGKASTCGAPQPGLTFAQNVFVGPTCGTNALRVSRLPYINHLGGDYRLPAPSPVACFLANVRRGEVPAKTTCRKSTTIMSQRARTTGYVDGETQP